MIIPCLMPTSYSLRRNIASIARFCLMINGVRAGAPLQRIRDRIDVLVQILRAPIARRRFVAQRGQLPALRRSAWHGPASTWRAVQLRARCWTRQSFEAISAATGCSFLRLRRLAARPGFGSTASASHRLTPTATRRTRIRAFGWDGRAQHIPVRARHRCARRRSDRGGTTDYARVLASMPVHSAGYPRLTSRQLHMLNSFVDSRPCRDRRTRGRRVSLASGTRHFENFSPYDFFAHCLGGNFR